MFGWYSFWGSSSKSTKAVGSSKIKGHARQVNEAVYELHKPPGNPSVQIVFFHGLYTEDCLDPHVSTWENEDGSCIWAATWLVEEFPSAHVLSVSYCACVGKSSECNLDMHNIGENLILDLMHANIGQSPHCPVILVGYCFGGLVIKELCCQMSLGKDLTKLEREKIKLETFLENLKGIFNYGTPHSGCSFVDKAKCVVESPLLEYFSYLNQGRSRLNHRFNQLYRGSKWKIDGLGESLPPKSGILQGVVVGSEASGRQGDNFNVLQVEHFSICKPNSKKDKRFYAFTNLLHGVVENEEDVHICQGLPRYPVDLERRAREVQEKLMSVEILGLVGMGGIGKTTLAKQVFNYISREFEYTCFVDNVKGIPKHELESSILSGFYQSRRKMERNRTSWNRLKGKTLIIMDDVDSLTQVQALPALESFGIGSRLVVTGRNESVLNNFESYDLYKVDFLQPDQAEKLFCQYAKLEEVVENPEETNQLQGRIKLVVEKCGGLPLTLEVMGCCLRGHATNVNYWEETIEKLGKAQSITGDLNDRIWAALKLSYDGLAPKEKKIFREAAIHFFERTIDEALAAWSGAYRNSETGWANLMRMSLVKEGCTIVHGPFHSFAIEHKTVWVHEHLRDLAASLSKGYKISSSTNEVSSCVKHLNANEMNATARIVRITRRFWDAQTIIEPLQSDSLVRFKKLRYLELDNVNFEGSFCNFPRKFSLLRWSGTTGCLFPSCSDTQTNNLTILELYDLDIPKDFPEVLGRLTNLRILSLRSLRQLDQFPENFGDLRRLKQLRLHDLDLQGLPSSFGCLSSLEDLALVLPQLECLPDNFCHLKGLKTLRLESSRLNMLPNNLGFLACLKHLTIMCRRELRMLPDSLGELVQVKTLHLFVPEVKILPATVGRLSALREMHFTSAVDFLPESFMQLSSLRTLDITCHKLEKLPDNLANFCSLETLKIRSNSLESLPESFGSLSALKELTLVIGRLKCLPSDFFSRFKVLKTLEIRIRCQDYDTDRLETLPYKLGLLSSLERLTIECPTLKMLPDSLGDLARLQTLCLRVKAVKALPATVGQLSALREMDFTSTVDYLPESLGHLTSLKVLQVESYNLEKLPCSIQNLCSLESLQISSNNLEIIPEGIGLLSPLTSCSIKSRMLRSLPDSIGKLSAFHTLTIREEGHRDTRPLFVFPEEGTLTIVSDNLKRLPDGIGRLSSLKICSIQSGSLRSLPDSIGDLSALQSLTVKCPNLKKLPDSLGNLASVRNLEICGNGLVSIPDKIGQLSSVRDLSVESESLTSLPISLGQLSGLQVLRIRCHNLDRLPDNLGNLTSLRDLEICGNGLVSIPDNIGQLSSLRDLSVESDSLRTLPSNIRQLSALRNLEVKCNNLDKLPHSFRDLSSLQDLYIQESGEERLQQRKEQLSSWGWIPVPLESLPPRKRDMKGWYRRE